VTDQPEPIRKSQLPTTPPPEWEFSSVFGLPHGCVLAPTDAGDIVVRRLVTYGDWEPVRPARWADEPTATVRDAARQTGPCGCGQPATPDVVHRQDGPCYMDQAGGLQTVELPNLAARQTGQQPDETTNEPVCGDEYDGEECELEPGHPAGHLSGNVAWSYGRATPAAGLDASQPATDRCTSCEHPQQYHDADGRCWFTVEYGLPGRDLVCPCKIRHVEETDQ